MVLLSLNLCSESLLSYVRSIAYSKFHVSYVENDKKYSMTNVSYEDQNKELCFYGRGIVSLWEDCLTNSALPTNAGSGLMPTNT